MHHLGIGAAHRGKEILAITDMTGVTVIELRTGEVLSARDIDQARAYWRNKQRSPGRWPGPSRSRRIRRSVPSGCGSSTPTRIRCTPAGLTTGTGCGSRWRNTCC
jgi:hypothetical protein